MRLTEAGGRRNGMGEGEPSRGDAGPELTLDELLRRRRRQRMLLQPDGAATARAGEPEDGAPRDGEADPSAESLRRVEALSPDARVPERTDPMDTGDAASLSDGTGADCAHESGADSPLPEQDGHIPPAAPRGARPAPRQGPGRVLAAEAPRRGPRRAVNRRAPHPGAVPNADDAERMFAGALLLGKPFAREIALQARPDDFRLPMERDWVRRARELAQRDEAIEASTLLAQVEDEEKHAQVVEMGRCTEGVPVPSSREAALEILKRVRHAARDRRLLEHIEGLPAILSNGYDPEAREAARAKLASLCSPDEGEEATELTVVDLATDVPRAPEPLVGDARSQVVARGDLVAVAGDSGAGKTMTSTDLAVGCASGTTGLCLPCQKCLVFCVTSDGDSHIDYKIKRVWAGRGGSREELARLPLWAHVDNDFNLDDDGCFGALVAALEKRGFAQRPGLVIIESLVTNVGPDVELNDQLSVRRWATRRPRALQARFPGLTVIVSAHLKKPQQQSVNDLGTRVAGSVQIRAAVDAIIGLVPRGRERFAVREVKRSRSGATFGDFEVRIDGAPGEPLVLRNVGALEPSLEDLRGAAAAVMAWFRGSGLEKASLKDIKVALARQAGAGGRDGFGERAVEGACKRLSESDPPRLVRVSMKPAVYQVAPRQGDLDLENLG